MRSDCEISVSLVVDSGLSVIVTTGSVYHMSLWYRAEIAPGDHGFGGWPSHDLGPAHAEVRANLP